MKKILPGIIIPVVFMIAGVCMTTYNKARTNVTLTSIKKEKSDSSGPIRLTPPSSVSVSVGTSIRNASIPDQTLIPKV